MGTFVKGQAGYEDLKFKSSGTSKQTFTRADASSRTLTLEQIDGAHIQFRTLASSIDDLVDGGYDVPIKPQSIFGGANNTNGHEVPNVADDVFVMRNTTEAIQGVKTFTGANVHTGTNSFSGITTYTGTRKGDKGADVASEATLFAAAGFPTDGNYFDITGTTGITAITGSGQVGTVITLHFDGALTITQDGTNIVHPGDKNITTVAGDELTYVEYATDDWRLIGGNIIPHDHSKAELGGVLPLRGAMVYSGVSQSTANGVYYDITWNQEYYDTDSIHDTATNNTRLTVPAGITKVKFSAQTSWASHATGYRTMFLRKNGGAPTPNFEQMTPVTSAVLLKVMMSTCAFTVTGGDYFELRVVQTSGGALEVNNGLDAWFAMEIVG